MTFAIHLGRKQAIKQPENEKFELHSIFSLAQASF